MSGVASRKSLEGSPSEKFFRHFQNEVTVLQERIDRLKDHSTVGGERDDAIEHCLAGIARLSDEVKDASSILAAYDQRTYAEAIKALTSKLQDVRSSLAPRPRFAFKSSPAFSAKKNASAISLHDAAEMAEERRKQLPGLLPVDPVATHSIPPQAATDEARRPSMVSNDDDLTARTATLLNLHACVVDLRQVASSDSPLAALTLRDVTNSLLICGRVAGAVHLTNVANSIIVIDSRQFRMHQSSRCHIYLHTTSRPIIEDCSQIGFAALPSSFRPPSDDSESDQWRNVDDFKWLRNEPSPNWSVLEKTLDEETWKDIERDDPNRAVDEILRGVNIISK